MYVGQGTQMYTLLIFWNTFIIFTFITLISYFIHCILFIFIFFLQDNFDRLVWIVLAVPLVVVGAIVFAITGSIGDPLVECLQDADYSELVAIVDKGLTPTKTPRHIAIIGAGMAGLTAAKFLQDAGHKVIKQ